MSLFIVSYICHDKELEPTIDSIIKLALISFICFL
jgi:hypothetical protein